MDTLRIKTKYDFEKFINLSTVLGSYYSQIELKNRKIILFEKYHRKNKIITFVIKYKLYLIILN